jgi:polysaccharide export outer membrane protein
MSKVTKKSVRLALLFLLLAATVRGQRTSASIDPRPELTEVAIPQNPVSVTDRAHLQPAQPEDPLRDSYALGPDDEVTVWVLEADELSTDPVRIGKDGYMNLPLVGRFRAAGLTVEQLEAELTHRLKTYVLEPNVAVSITEFRSQPVSVIGSVKDPGVHQLEGHKTLVEVLALAGGLREDASHSVKITRELRWGRIPLATAKDDSTGQFSVAEVSLEDFMEARNPEQNVLIKPHDVISVPRAEMIYVIGAVVRSGGFVLRERESISVLQALALAGGLGRAASVKNSKVLRPSDGGSKRTEIAINLKDILSNRTPDFPLRQDDILFIPRSGGKAAALRTAEAIVGVGAGIAVYRGGAR